MIIKYANLLLFILVILNLNGLLEITNSRGVRKISETNMLNKYLPATFCGRINGDAVAIRFLRDNIVQLYKNEIHHESTTFYFDNDLLFLHTTNGLLGKLTRDVRFFEQKNILFLKGPKAYLTDSNCYPSSYSLTPKINYKDYSFEDFFILELNNLSYLKRQLGQNE